jgi:hypothetical protein
MRAAKPVPVSHPRPSRESDAGTKESDKRVPAPWPFLQPDSDLRMICLEGVSRNVHLPATLAVNGAGSFVVTENPVWG